MSLPEAKFLLDPAVEAAAPPPDVEVEAAAPPPDVEAEAAAPPPDAEVEAAVPVLAAAPVDAVVDIVDVYVGGGAALLALRFLSMSASTPSRSDPRH